MQFLTYYKGRYVVLDAATIFISESMNHSINRFVQNTDLFSKAPQTSGLTILTVPQHLYWNYIMKQTVTNSQQQIALLHNDSDEPFFFIILLLLVTLLSSWIPEWKTNELVLCSES